MNRSRRAGTDKETKTTATRRSTRPSALRRASSTGILHGSPSPQASVGSSGLMRDSENNNTTSGEEAGQLQEQARDQGDTIIGR